MIYIEIAIVDSIKFLKSESTIIDDRIRTEIPIRRRRFHSDSLIALAYSLLLIVCGGRPSETRPLQTGFKIAVKQDLKPGLNKKIKVEKKVLKEVKKVE